MIMIYCSYSKVEKDYKCIFCIFIVLNIFLTSFMQYLITEIQLILF